jgi:hypothetical protein
VVGRALLRADWKHAVELLLMPRPGERQDVAAARRHFAATRDALGAHHMMPHFMHAERALLLALHKVVPQGPRLRCRAAPCRACAAPFLACFLLAARTAFGSLPPRPSARARGFFSSLFSSLF